MKHRVGLQLLMAWTLSVIPVRSALCQDIAPSDGAQPAPGGGAPPSDTGTPAAPPSEGTPAATPPTTSAPDKEAGTEKKPAEEETDEEKEKREEEQKKQDKKLRELRDQKGAYDPVKEALYDINTHQYEKALSRLDKILTNNPKHPQAHYVRAVAYVMTRQYPKAAADYREVIRLVPNSELGRRAQEGLKKLNF